MQNDPLWKLRHALAGMAPALLLAVLTAALAGAWLGDVVAGPSYGARVTVYALLLLYVVVGAVVLFVKLARHETRRVSARRVFLWWLSLWAWPALLLLAARRPPPSA